MARPVCASADLLAWQVNRPASKLGQNIAVLAVEVVMAVIDDVVAMTVVVAVEAVIVQKGVVVVVVVGCAIYGQ